MRKAFCVGLLLVFAWTSAVGAQTTDTEEFPNFLLFRRDAAARPHGGLEAYSGYDWVVWSDAMKTFYVVGFLSAHTGLAEYVERVAIRAAVFAALGEVDVQKASPPAFTARFKDVQNDMATLTASSYAFWHWPFRVGVYMLELDAIYEDVLNRDIYVIDAMYIANERLNGREVDLTVWRNKGKQEGT